MPPSAAHDDPRVPALDGVRGVAILLVLFYHFTMFGRLIVLASHARGLEGAVSWRIGYAAMSGWVGVDLFFVLSGYLITRILLDQKGRPDFFRAFYARRAARILPLYYVYLAGYALFAFGWGSRDELRSLGWPALFGTNIALGLFGDGAVPHALQHLWSLAVEEQFYLLFPLAVLALRPALLRAGCVLGAIGAVVFRLAVRQEVPLCSYLTPARFDGILVGAFVATMLPRELAKAPSERAVRTTRWALAAGAAVVAGLLVWRRGFFGEDALFDVFGRTLVVVSFGALVAACVLLRESPVSRFLSLAPLRFFGRYSYGMYVLHMPLLAAMFALHAGIRQLALATGSLLVGYGLFVAIASAGTVLAALASYAVLERRFLALRDRPRAPRPEAATAAEPAKS
jgi:peptidoglycan/LPS O-acetylase OafA/YrhL